MDMMSGALVYHAVWVCHVYSVLCVSVFECVQLIIKDAKKMDEQCQQELVTQKPHQRD